MDIKICGLTNLEDARLAVSAGADFIGFVFAENSPRQVTPETVASILAGLSSDVRALGVFVNATPAQVLDVARKCGLWGVQLHGDESASDFKGFPFPLWRAVRAGNGICAPLPAEWPEAERLLVDAYDTARYGGTGRLADWPTARLLARERAVMLAGGLTAEHVATAIAAVGPAGVDVSSGVEAAPGRKDPDKLLAFVEHARAATTP